MDVEEGSGINSQLAGGVRLSFSLLGGFVLHRGRDAWVRIPSVCVCVCVCVWSPSISLAKGQCDERDRRTP